jgi:hypothetical protein
MSGDDPAGLAQLATRLAAAREALLAALRGLAERDFAAELEPGRSIVAALAQLAPAERAAVAVARAASGLAPRPLATPAGPRARPTPPLVVHDLAGARHETLLLIDALAVAGDAPSDELAAALTAVTEREQALAERIAGRERGSAGAP